MMNMLDRTGSTLAQLVIAVSAVVALLQYMQSVEQNKTEAALSLIAIHNNERFYDARQGFLQAYFSLFQDETLRALPEDQRAAVLPDYVIANTRDTTGRELTREELDLISLALIHLYDTAARCIRDGVCRQDITDYHFRSFMRLLLLAYQNKLPEWQQTFAGLGNDSRALLDNRIRPTNLLQSACAEIGLRFCA
ncbi:MAG: hypothetical protein HC850_04980 [Rhodomicrobium sp.]|nr:hypothetical protein [Rhodomicrobium sp.]